MTPHGTETFIPLSAVKTAPGERQDFRVTVLSQADNSHPFQSLEAKSTTSESKPKSNAKTCEPRVAVQRDGDRVTNIRINCSCGQVMELACIYQDSTKPV